MLNLTAEQIERIVNSSDRFHRLTDTLAVKSYCISMPQRAHDNYTRQKRYAKMGFAPKVLSEMVTLGGRFVYVTELADPVADDRYRKDCWGSQCLGYSECGDCGMNTEEAMWAAPEWPGVKAMLEKVRACGFEFADDHPGNIGWVGGNPVIVDFDF